MTDTLLIITVALSLVACFFSIASYIKQGNKKVDNDSLQKSVYDFSANIKEHINSITKFNNDNFYRYFDTLTNTLSEKLSDTERRIEDLTKTNEYRLNNMREVLEKSVRLLQESNSNELQTMRQVVDEKLSATLETRLNKSFEIINSRLEAVYKGLGEMQGLEKV